MAVEKIVVVGCYPWSAWSHRKGVRYAWLLYQPACPRWVQHASTMQQVCVTNAPAAVLAHRGAPDFLLQGCHHVFAIVSIHLYCSREYLGLWRRQLGRDTPGGVWWCKCGTPRGGPYGVFHRRGHSTYRGRFSSTPSPPLGVSGGVFMSRTWYPRRLIFVPEVGTISSAWSNSLHLVF